MLACRVTRIPMPRFCGRGLFGVSRAYVHSGNAPTYAPDNSGRSWADGKGSDPDGWETDGEMVRSAYTLRAEDDGAKAESDLGRRM